MLVKNQVQMMLLPVQIVDQMVVLQHQKHLHNKPLVEDFGFHPAFLFLEQIQMGEIVELFHDLQEPVYEYLQLFEVDLESPADVVGLAMSIEAQALDMYHRASENAKDPESKEALHQIALEEQEHLKQLGKLFEKI